MFQNRVTCYEYTLEGGVRNEFEKEVDRWIEEDILRPWEGEEKNVLLPLLAEVQLTKNNV